ncbi:AMM_1a_G0052340.mRNA.1.CDS.1 [Saccharomyces cerevisiae]|nr:AMM_1a_G0052340.mRNA.1.CDS.1 [Saccharomyces cerevisiae]CAI6917059.1 AMM_1a_G0052340.mRNA.1.CDS.1 [Saccharomyces cerevisiae]
MEHTAHIFPIIIKGSPPVMSSNPRRQYRLNLRSINCLKKPRVRIWQAPWPLEPALSAAKMPRAAHAHARPRTPTHPTLLRSKPQYLLDFRAVGISRLPSAAISVYPAHFFS